MVILYKLFHFSCKNRKKHKKAISAYLRKLLTIWTCLMPRGPSKWDDIKVEAFSVVSRKSPTNCKSGVLQGIRTIAFSLLCEALTSPPNNCWHDIGLRCIWADFRRKMAFSKTLLTESFCKFGMQIRDQRPKIHRTICVPFRMATSTSGPSLVNLDTFDYFKLYQEPIFQTTVYCFLENFLRPIYWLLAFPYGCLVLDMGFQLRVSWGEFRSVSLQMTITSFKLNYMSSFGWSRVCEVFAFEWLPELCHTSETKQEKFRKASWGDLFFVEFARSSHESSLKSIHCCWNFSSMHPSLSEA